MNILKKSGGLILILFITAILYGRTVGFEFVNWDDHLYISENPLVNGEAGFNEILTTTFEGHYHPLVLLSLRFDHWIASGAPWTFHVHNLFLHLLNILILWLLLRRLLPGSPAPFFISLLFALHPMQVEAVAWATARKDVLYAFWALLAMLAWVFYRQKQIGKYYILSLLLFLLACLAKAQSVMLAPLILLVDHQFFRVGRIRQKVLEYLPLFLIAAVFGGVAVWAQAQTGYTSEESFKTPVIWIVGNAAYALVSYIFKLLVPLGLSAYYPYPQPGVDIPAIVFWGALPLALILVFIVARFAWKRKLSGFGFAFFLVMLFPMLRFLPVSNFIIADRYTYMSMIGFFIGLNAVLEVPGPKWRNLIFSILAMAFVILSWQRVGIWRDSETLLDDILIKYPDIYPALNARADIFIAQGRFDEAIEDLDRATAIRPEAARAWRNRGLAYARAGMLEKALPDLGYAIELEPRDAGTLINRAMVYELRGDTSAALEDLDRALKLNPAQPSALLNRANLYIRSGNVTAARDDLQRLLELRPGYPPALAAYGLALMKTGEWGQAREYLEKAINSGYRHPLARIKLAESNLEAGDLETAGRQIRDLLAAYPGQADLWLLQCRFLRQSAKYAELLIAADRLISMEKFYAEGYFFRGYAHALSGDTALACRDLEAAWMLGNAEAEELLEQYCQ